MGISIREYARQRGVSHVAVQKAIKAGRITPLADGTIDMAQADKDWKANTTHKAGKKLVPNEAITAAQDTLRENGEQFSSGASMTYMQAKTANEILKAQTNRIKLRQLKGELIEKEMAGNEVFRLAREARDYWINWPARISSQMAAEISTLISTNLDQPYQFDNHAMHLLLERYVREYLQETSEPKPRFNR